MDLDAISGLELCAAFREGKITGVALLQRGIDEWLEGSDKILLDILEEYSVADLCEQ